MRTILILCASLLVAIAASAAKPAKKDLTPFEPKEAVSSHTPFLTGECGVCHKRANPSNPGPLLKAADELCFDCHDEFQGKAPKKSKHPPSRKDCVSCHSPHNAKKKNLLL